MHEIYSSWPKPLEAFFEYSPQQPNKRLGQHFLVEPSVLAATIEAGQINANDQVIEIGAGCGILTEKLLAHAGNVIAYEIDQELVSFLNSYFEQEIRAGKLRIINQDVRTLAPQDILSASYKIVGNIPYYLTSPLIRQVVGLAQKPSIVIFLVQEEVALRICAKPGEMSLLSLITQLAGIPQMVKKVARTGFYPVPKVDSALLKIEIPSQPRYTLSAQTLDQLMTLAKHAFSKRRKTMANALTFEPYTKEFMQQLLTQAEIAPELRPQELTIEDWIRLTHVFSSATIKQ